MRLEFLLTTLTVGFVLAASASATDIRVSLRDGGLGSYSKSVESIREHRYANLIAQEYDFSCGAASLATILRYAYGLRVTEREIIEGMLAVSDEEQVRKRGFSLLDMKNYLSRVGFRGRGYEVVPAMLAEMKVPTIALVDVKGYQHFVVLRKVAGDRAFIADPARGNHSMPVSEFLEGWSGVLFAVIGDNYNRFSALANPKPPLSLRARRADYLPASDLELVEIGFRREQIL